MQRLALEPFGDPSAQGHQRTEIETGLDAHAGEQIGQVFGRDIAARARRMRATADAAGAGIEAAHAGLPRSKYIRGAETARIVEVAARQLVAGDGKALLEECLHLQRIGVADGIGQADTVDTGIECRAHQAQHFGRFDAALNRAAEGRRQADFDQASRAFRIAQIDDAADLFHHFVGRFAQVRQAVRMAGRQRQQHRVRVGLDRAFGTFQIRHQHRRQQARQRFCEGHQIGGIGELRHQFGRHEGADLDFAQARRMRGTQPFELVRGGQYARQDLQAITQADFANHDRLGQVHRDTVPCQRASRSVFRKRCRSGAACQYRPAVPKVLSATSGGSEQSERGGFITGTSPVWRSSMLLA